MPEIINSIIPLFVHMFFVHGTRIRRDVLAGKTEEQAQGEVSVDATLTGERKYLFGKINNRLQVCACMCACVYVCLHMCMFVCVVWMGVRGSTP